MPKPASLLRGGRNFSRRTPAFEVDYIKIFVSIAKLKERVCAVLLTY
jgi:hypothetical protein